MENSLFVCRIPRDVDTEGLREFMSRFGEVEDCLVLKEWITGWPRGYGFVAFASIEDAKAALAFKHFLGSGNLEVTSAKPKEEMRSSGMKETKIFVGRICNSVTKDMLRSYFEVYGEIKDLYMPKKPRTKAHRRFGFITFKSADSVDTLMTETHELGGSVMIVDQRTSKRSYLLGVAVFTGDLLIGAMEVVAAADPHIWPIEAMNSFNF